jgi:hypothetical protein
MQASFLGQLSLREQSGKLGKILMSPKWQIKQRQPEIPRFLWLLPESRACLGPFLDQIHQENEKSRADG